MRSSYQRTQRRACRDAAVLMENGVKNAIASGATTPDLGGRATTALFAAAVIAAMRDG